ncbi:MAG: DUF3108 domain-containing protein [Hoeflea sp.]|uniref:DUF3108 domain-containing protein n=1 Tax=Hoeflea sp. TaxID=1940281 RepID=UPI0032EEDCD9
MSAPAHSEPVRVYADYTVSLAGLPVGYLNFATEINGRDYRLEGSLRPSIFAGLFASIEGAADASGRIGDTSFRAAAFSAVYSTGSKAQRIEIDFDDGDVTATRHEPAKRPRKGDWVPLKPTDLKAVLDPMSGMMVPAGASVCPRSLPVFDGDTRVTLHLRPQGRRPFITEGFKGDVVVCSIRFEPVAGYRKSSSAIAYLRKLEDMEVWYAESEAGGFLAPVYVHVQTEVGQVRVYATRFGIRP